MSAVAGHCGEVYGEISLEDGNCYRRPQSKDFIEYGDIVRQYKCAIGPNETTLELRARLAEYGAGLLMGCMRDLPDSLRRAHPQDGSEASYAPRVKSTTSRVVWDVMTASDVYNLQRALSHMYPLQTKFREMVVRLYSVTIMKDRTNTIDTVPDTADHSTSTPHTTEKSRFKSVELFLDSQTDPPGVTGGPMEGDIKTNIKRHRRSRVPGKIIYAKGMAHLLIICRDNRLISVKQLCVVGKKPCSAVDFYNGYLSYVPKNDWMFY